MGDNRNNSGDSRVFGPVSEEAIMGEAFAVYWPLGHISGL
jgi:signal peptidase I